MSDTLVPIASSSLVKHSHVNFQPPELERIRACVFKNIGVVARAFCESELSMLCALQQGKAQIGTVDNCGSSNIPRTTRMACIFQFLNFIFSLLKFSFL